MNHSTIYESPFGRLKLFSNGKELTRILLPSQLSESDVDFSDNADPILQQACDELESYFAGTRRSLRSRVLPRRDGNSNGRSGPNCREFRSAPRSPIPSWQCESVGRRLCGQLVPRMAATKFRSSYHATESSEQTAH